MASSPRRPSWAAATSRSADQRAAAGYGADHAGIPAAIFVIAAVTALSGIDVALRMYETRRHPPAQIS